MDLRAQDNGIEFLVGVGAAAAIFSAVHSSLWSARNFGDTEETASSCRTFSYVAAGATLAFATVASVLTHSLWSFVGAALFTVLMMAGYRYSLNQAGSKRDKPGESY